MTLPNDTTDQPTRALCVGCDQRPATDASLTCRPCRHRLVQALDEIRTGYPRLDPTPGAAGLTGAPAAPGFGSRSPASDTVLVLTDTRRHTHDPDEPERAQGVLGVVAWWADQAREVGVLVGGPRRRFDVDRRGVVTVRSRSVVGECEQLAGVAGRLGSVWWFGAMLAVLDATAGHVRRALGEHERTIPLGECPLPAPGYAALFDALVADAGEVLAARASRVPRCGGEVRARAFGDTARCRRCGHRWEGEHEVRQLGAKLGDAMLDLPGLARYFDVSSLATLRSWAHRDGWRRQKVGRRTLYRLADARDSWWRALERRQARVMSA